MRPDIDDIEPDDFYDDEDELETATGMAFLDYLIVGMFRAILAAIVIGIVAPNLPLWDKFLANAALIILVLV